MRRLILISSAVALLTVSASAQVVHTPVVGKMGITLYDMRDITVPRTEIVLPMVKGYNLYKADLHVHTIYSDGEVTPRERMREAWYDGLDVIALTDHLEIRTYEKFMLKALAPYSKDGSPFVYANAGAGNAADNDAPLLSNPNAAYDEASMIIRKENIPILVIRGTEIWRDPKTVGEYNALFLKDVNAVFHKDLFECFRRVKEQGGLIVHNHPGYSRTTLEKSEIQERIYAEGWLDGVEAVNRITLYPQMIDRCVGEKLAILANTDVHRPSSQLWPRDGGCFRTMTFILAKECTEEAIKDAILDRRTIGYCANNLVGEQVWLEEFANEAVDCRLVNVNEKNGNRCFQLTNTCSIPFVLCRDGAERVLNPFQSIRVDIRCGKENVNSCCPEFTVNNMWTVGDSHPQICIRTDR